MAERLDAFHEALNLIPRPQKRVEKYNLVQPVSLAHCSRLKHSRWETFFFLSLFVLFVFSGQ